MQIGVLTTLVQLGSNTSVVLIWPSLLIQLVKLWSYLRPSVLGTVIEGEVVVGFNRKRLEELLVSQPDYIHSGA